MYAAFHSLLFSPLQHYGGNAMALIFLSNENEVHQMVRPHEEVC